MEAKNLTYIVKYEENADQWSARVVEIKGHDFLAFGLTPSDAIRESMDIINRSKIEEDVVSRKTAVFVTRDSYDGVSADIERYFSG